MRNASSIYKACVLFKPSIVIVEALPSLKNGNLNDYPSKEKLKFLMSILVMIPTRCDCRNYCKMAQSLYPSNTEPHTSVQTSRHWFWVV